MVVDFGRIDPEYHMHTRLVKASKTLKTITNQNFFKKQNSTGQTET